MQDTFISLGRGIDGVVGRMVDRFGDAGSGERSVKTEHVELLRYAIVSMADNHERVLHVEETLVTDGATGKELTDRLLAPFATHADRDNLRVHTRVLRRWPRREPPAPVRSARATPAAPVAPPTAEPAKHAPVKQATPKTRPRKRKTLPPKSAAVAPRPQASAPAARKAQPKAPPASALDRRLMAALATAGAKGLSMGELVKHVGERSATLRSRLQQLGRDGTVRRAGDGLKTRYRLTDQ